MKSVAIVGSRDFVDYEYFKEKVSSTLEKWGLEEIQVISGGATGTDSMAQKWALENTIRIRVFPANWKKYGKYAGPHRNTKIIDHSQYCIAFPSQKGKGTQDTMEKAIKKNIPLKVFYID